jgi:hypothetical protein
MAELVLTREQLNTLIVSETAQGSTDITRVINEIYLTYPRSQIVTPRAPALARPQQIRTMRLDGVVYTERSGWTLRWQQIYEENARVGVQVFPDRDTLIGATNITNSRGQSLTEITVGASAGLRPPVTAAQSLAVSGTQGPPGLGIGDVFIDSNGDLRIILDDLQDITAGQVVPQFTIGSVTQNPSGLGSSATLTGEAPNYQLNLVLDTSATTGNFQGTVELTEQGLLAANATRRDFVLAQIQQQQSFSIALSIALGS